MKTIQLSHAANRLAHRSDSRVKRNHFPGARSALVAGLGLALGGFALPAFAANWWTAAPILTIGSASVNVRNAGALGNGVHDDTAAFQAAIKSLPSSGGTVTVPAGRYMINALTSINLRSNTRLKLDPAAQLVAIPNNQTRSYVVKAWRVSNVEITGGQIIGERVKHVGSTGEWGMGVDVRSSSKVYVHDLSVSDCWGDGLFIGALGSAGSATPSTDVTISHVVSNNNRRQGMSITVVNRVYVANSTFSNTNGTAPQAGIDIEPSTQGTSQNVRVEGSTMTGNAGNGMELHAYVSGLVVAASTVKGNNGFGVLGVDTGSTTLSKNLITENGLDGMGATGASHDWQVTGNTITYNSTRWFITNHKSIYTLTNSTRDVQINSTAKNIVLTGNILSPKP